MHESKRFFREAKALKAFVVGVMSLYVTTTQFHLRDIKLSPTDRQHGQKLEDAGLILSKRFLQQFVPPDAS
jgi:hypothetical protein